jgi:hypothetical protein
MEVKLVLPDGAVSAQIEDLWGRFSEEDRRTILREAVVQWLSSNPTYCANSLEQAIEQTRWWAKNSSDAVFAEKLSKQLGVRETHTEAIRVVVKKVLEEQTRDFIHKAFSACWDAGYGATMVKSALDAAKSSMEEQMGLLVMNFMQNAMNRSAG